MENVEVTNNAFKKDIVKYRTEPVNYGLYHANAEILPNMTSEGAVQIVDTWFYNNSVPSDYIHFRAKDPANSSDGYMWPVFPHNPIALNDSQNRETKIIFEVRKLGFPLKLDGFSIGQLVEEAKSGAMFLSRRSEW